MKNALRITTLTESLKDTPIKLKGQILLYTYVVPDGIGDLILQIRTYNQLNQIFPGSILCVTCCENENRDLVESVAKSNNFESSIFLFNEFSEDPSIYIDQENLDLTVVLSVEGKAPTSFYNPRASYFLNEMNDQAALIADDVEMRSQKGIISFYPAGEGIWHDALLDANSNGESHLSASKKLKRVFQCQDFSTPSEAKAWFDQTWVSQSHCYNVDFFLTTLLAQTKYVNDQKNDSERIVVKANLKDREGNAWPDLKIKLESDALKSAFKNMNIRSIEIDSDTFIEIDKDATRTIRITSEKIPIADYPLFQSMINGVNIPGGDNTCSEAFSNTSTKLPPFPELRLIKYNVLKDLIAVIGELDLEKDAQKWLSEIYELALEINSTLAQPSENKPSIDEDKIVEWSARLEKIWSSSMMPKETWVKLSEYIAKHSLNERFEALVKEQICLRRDPQLLKLKNDLINSEKPTDEIAIEYSNSVQLSNEAINKKFDELIEKTIQSIVNNDQNTHSSILLVLEDANTFSDRKEIKDALINYFMHHEGLEALNEEAPNEISIKWTNFIVDLIKESSNCSNSEEDKPKPFELLLPMLLLLPLNGWENLFNELKTNHQTRIFEADDFDEPYWIDFFNENKSDGAGEEFSRLKNHLESVLGPKKMFVPGFDRFMHPDKIVDEKESFKEKIKNKQ